MYFILISFTQFVAERRAMHQRGYMPRRGSSVGYRRLLLRLSIRLRLYIETPKQILKPFHLLVAVFPYETLWQNSDGVPLNGSSNALGMINRDFRPVSRLLNCVVQHMRLFNQVLSQNTCAQQSSANNVSGLSV